MSIKTLQRCGYQSGQALVEMALVLFILLAIIVAGIDALQIAMTHFTVHQAARTAAHRGAITGGHQADARQAALDILNAGMTTKADRATITVSCAPPTGLTGCPRYSAFTVQIVYDDQVWAPDPLGIFSKFSARASSTRTTEIDQQPESFNTSAPAGRGAQHVVPKHMEQRVPGSGTGIPGSQP